MKNTEMALFANPIGLLILIPFWLMFGVIWLIYNGCLLVKEIRDNKETRRS